MPELNVLIVASNFDLMTKQVRIENADTGPYGVEVWDKHRPDGMGGFNQSPDTLVKTLSHPTAMTDAYITSTHYLVVKENSVSNS